MFQAICLTLVELRIVELLAALLPMLALPSTSKGVGGSSSSNISGSSVPQAAGAAPHSKTGAASRAARVLRERRQAEAGPFPSNLLCVLGCTLQLLDAFCMCFGEHTGVLQDGGTPCVITETADTLLAAGQLLTAGRRPSIPPALRPRHNP